MAPCADFSALRAWPADVLVVTSDGSSIAAHSSVLAAASPVLEQMIMTAPRGRDAVVRVLGAPSDAVATFLRFLYSRHPRDTAEEEAAAVSTGRRCWRWRTRTGCRG
ncbi:unnamed protein product [Urochloa humidicola]